MIQNKKRIISLILMLTLLVSSLVVGAITASAEETTATYTFSEYPAGVQYVAETHELDDNITLDIEDCHLTTQLRIYSSSTNNGVAIFKASEGKTITGTISFNMGYKTDTLKVYGSNDNGSSWTEIGGVATTTTSYKDYSIALNAEYDQIKLDVSGTSQIRIASITLTVKDKTTTPAPEYEASFVVPEGLETVNPITGSTIEMPAGPNAPSGNFARAYTFAGWAMSSVGSVTTTAPELKQAGEKVTLDADTAFYAVYSYSENSGSGVEAFVKVTTTPSDWTGEYLIVYETGNVAFNGGLDTLDAKGNTVSVTISSGTIEASEDLRNAIFTIAKSGTDYSIKSHSGKYIGRSATSNGLNSGSSELVNTISLDNSGNAVIAGDGGPKLQYNSASDQLRFRYFASAQKAIQLYKLQTVSAVTTYYTSVLEANAGCQHNYGDWNEPVEGNCVVQGTVGYYQCSNEGCGLYFDAEYNVIDTILAPLDTNDHAYVYTASEDGKHNRECINVAQNGVKCPNESNNLSCSDSDNDCDHKCDYCTNDNISNHIGGKATCKALAQCEECGEQYGEINPSVHTIENGKCVDCCAKVGWSLVTDVNNLAVGDKIVIVANGYVVAMSTTQNNNNRGQVVVEKSEDKTTVTFGSDVQILELKKSTVEGTFAFYTGSGYLYAASSSSNHLKTKATLDADGSWKITIADGIASVVAQGENTRNVMQYNYNDTLFACYSTASQKAISIYKYKDEGYDHEYTDGTCSCGKTAGASIGDVYYDTFADALAAVKTSEDKTLVLNGDVEDTNAAGIDLTGITIDLNGHKLTAAGVIDFSGTGAIKDSSAGKAGRVVVEKGGFIGVSNKTLPVCVAEDTENGTGTYVIADVKDQYMCTPDATNNKYVLEFRPSFVGIDHFDIFANGTTEEDITFWIRITRDSNDSVVYGADIWVDAKYVKVAYSESRTIRLTLTNATKGEVYTIQLVMKSGDQYQYVGNLGTIKADGSYEYN